MTLAIATMTLKIDLDDDGTYETNLSNYWPRPRALNLTPLGRKKNLGAAGPVTLALPLNNEDGRFAPLNASSPYWDGAAGVQKVRPGRRVQVQVTFNAITYDYFTGTLDELTVNPETQMAHLKAVCEMARLAHHDDVRLPLMLNALTGNVVGRLLDYSENDNAIANERFAVDDDGWTDVGGPTSTDRVTTGTKLHEPACYEVITPSGAKGTEYLIPSPVLGDWQGKTWVVHAWVSTDDTGEEGNEVAIRGSDTVGTHPTAIVALTSEPQRVEKEVTWNGAATAFSVQVLSNASNPALNFRLHAAGCVPKVNAIPRAIDAGDLRLDRIAFDAGKPLAYIQRVRDSELDGLFFVAPDGTATYHGKSHRWSETHGNTSQATFDERGRVKHIDRLRDRVREVLLNFQRWEVGTEQPVFVLYGAMPRLIPANDSITVDAPFGGTIVQGTITPVAGTDYTITADAAGLGADRTGDVTLAFEAFGGAARAVFTETSGDDLYLHSFRVLGIPVRPSSDRSPARAEPSTIVPIADVLEHTYRDLANQAAVESWATHLADFFGNKQRPALTLELDAPFPQADITGSDMVQILSLAVGDRITVTNDTLPYSLAYTTRYFYIESIARRINQDSAHALCRLSPVKPDQDDATRYFTIGTSTIGGSDPLAPG
jgi:hypothetical protein